jgi:hypothetical protein
MYVIHDGEFIFTSVYPGTMQRDTWDGSPEPCARCGRDTRDEEGNGTCGRFELDDGLVCDNCYTSPPETRLGHALDWIDCRVDTVYWWYCDKFGQRVPDPTWEHSG